MADDEALESGPRGLDEAAVEAAIQSVEQDTGTPAETETSAGQEPQPEATQAAQVRDEQGRFAKRAPEPEAQAGKSPTPSPQSPPEPTAAEAATAEAEQPAGTEFGTARYRADGLEHEIPGSAEGSDGVFIPAQSWPQLQEMLAASHGAARRIREVSQQLRDAENRAQAQATTKDRIIQKLDELAEKGLLVQWAEQAERSWPELKRGALEEGTRKRSEFLEQRTRELEQAEEARNLLPRITAHLQETISRLAQSRPEYQWVDTERVFRRLSRNLGQIYSRTDHDDPAGRWRTGEWVVDHRAIEAEIRDIAELLQGSRKAAAEAVKANAVVNTKTKAPPTVTASGASASAERKLPTAKTRAEAEALLAKAMEDAEEFAG